MRVVVLHAADGTVEHNRYFPLQGPQAQKYVLLKVAPNERKKIFIFANEESVSAVEGAAGTAQSLSACLSGYTEGSAGFETDVNKLYFAPDYSSAKAISMSAAYELDFKEGFVEKTFYVVRVATKFTVSYTNRRKDAVKVDKITLSRHVDKNFLMAHVGSYPHAGTYAGWIDWLKAVSDASSVNDDYATTAAGWLKDYSLPAQANRTLTYSHNVPVTVPAPTIPAGATEPVPGLAENATVFYLPESMNPKAGATDGEQEYTMSVYINGVAEPMTFTLPNLKSLFRNTHVVVDITFYNLNEVMVRVIPYSEKRLYPIFGLDNKTK